MFALKIPILCSPSPDLPNFQFLFDLPRHANSGTFLIEKFRASKPESYTRTYIDRYIVVVSVFGVEGGF